MPIMKEFIRYVIEYPYIKSIKGHIYDFFHPIKSWKNRKTQENKND